MRWDDLNMSDKSRMIRLAVDSGITDLRAIRDVYNSYAEGGSIRRKNKETQQVADEDNPNFVGPTLEKLMNGPKFPESLYNGPELPRNFGQAPIDWDRKEALQMYAESRNHANAVSQAGAKGPYQIMPRNWKAYSKKLGLTGDVQDYNNNKAVRDQMMRELRNAAWVNKGNAPDSVRAAKVFGAYNWGSKNMTDFLGGLKEQGIDIYNSMDWIDMIPNEETKNYINFILREKDGKGDYTIEAFEKALPHRFDEFPEAIR